jgi:hypothetical protein
MELWPESRLWYKDEKQVSFDTFIRAFGPFNGVGNSMRKLVKTGAVALMMTSMAGNVFAATQAGCARPDDMSAMKTAAVQQRLMVAALSCDATPAYNHWVQSYQKELQTSDHNLQAFFIRMHGKTGTEDYHAFKTRLANASSMDSIHDISGYCASAQQMFDEVSNSHMTLAAFIASKQTSVDNAYSPCPVLTAKAKPAKRVVPAQGKGVPAH